MCMVLAPQLKLLKSTNADNVGAAGGDRTHDPWLRRPILYPLSYSRKVKCLKRCKGYSYSVAPSMESMGCTDFPL